MRSKSPWQPGSHMCPMDIKGSVVRSGTMYICRPCGGKPGTSNSPSCVDFMMFPLGLRMEIGFLDILLLSTGVSSVPKFAVAPVSAIQIMLHGCDDLGGPWSLESSADRHSLVWSNFLLSSICFSASHSFPPFQGISR